MIAFESVENRFWKKYAENNPFEYAHQVRNGRIFFSLLTEDDQISAANRWRDQDLEPRDQVYLGVFENDSCLATAASLGFDLNNI